MLLLLGRVAVVAVAAAAAVAVAVVVVTRKTHLSSLARSPLHRPGSADIVGQCWSVGHILKFSSAYSLICLLVPSHIFHRVHLGLSKNGLHTHTDE